MEPRRHCSPHFFLTITSIIVPQQPLLLLRIILVGLFLFTLPPVTCRGCRSIGDGCLGRHIVLTVPAPVFVSTGVVIVVFCPQWSVAGSVSAWSSKSSEWDIGHVSSDVLWAVQYRCAKMGTAWLV